MLLCPSGAFSLRGGLSPLNDMLLADYPVVICLLKDERILPGETDVLA